MCGAEKKSKKAAASAGNNRLTMLYRARHQCCDAPQLQHTNFANLANINHKQQQKIMRWMNKRSDSAWQVSSSREETLTPVTMMAMTMPWLTMMKDTFSLMLVLNYGQPCKRKRDNERRRKTGSQAGKKKRQKS